MARLSLYSLGWLLDHEEQQLTGVTYVESLAGFSVLSALSTSGKLKEPEGAKMMTMGLDTFPLRIRNIYLVQQPRWFGWFWGLVKYFLRKKLRDRLHVLGDDFAALHAAVPPEFLPPELGGTLATPQSAMLDEMEAIEKATGKLGGFAIPMRAWKESGGERKKADRRRPLTSVRALMLSHTRSAARAQALTTRRARSAPQKLLRPRPPRRARRAARPSERPARRDREP